MIENMIMLAALIGVYFLIRSIFNYEVRLAGLDNKRSLPSFIRNEGVSVNAQYYKSYKYLS